MSIFKKFTAILLVLCMSLTLPATAFAAEISVDPYSVEAIYVEELVTMTAEEIAALPEAAARELFEEAFPVSSDEFSESDVRLALDGWAFALKFQTMMSMVAQAESLNADASVGGEVAEIAATSSTTANKTYYGSVGLAWVRDTTSSGSPLTLGEILSGVYTLEVDYISWETAATILAASSDYDVYEDLAEQVAVGASGTALGAIVCTALGITGAPATIASGVVGVVVAFGWSWLSNLNRANMYDCFETMDKDDFMKVQFMYASNMVNRFYTEYTPSSYTFENPFPGTCGTWYTGSYGYLYTY